MLGLGEFDDLQLDAMLFIYLIHKGDLNRLIWRFLHRLAEFVDLGTVLLSDRVTN
jgi:hypothetical protein